MKHAGLAWTMIAAAPLLLLAGAVPATAAGPDHPVITEMYQDPPGVDSPVGRNLANLHQEYIEIYLPPLADLAPGLNKDALNLAFYEVEGDSSNPGLVNYRIDLPTFDLDPSNGLTGLPRPSSGVVVLGWVDYVGNPPTDLAGTPTTRVALIDGGITSAADFTFIAINGSHFTGTANFPVPVAISHLDTVTDPAAVNGKIEQGSGVYLLMNRDHPEYPASPYCGQTDPGAGVTCNPFPDLASGVAFGGLSENALLDAFAGNDDPAFRVDRQPYDPPTGDQIDLEVVLPLGGAYSLLAPQVEENGHGYARLLVDVVKTTESGAPDDPVVDALGAYRTIDNLSPFRATPGRVHFTTSPAELSLADPSLQVFEVLTHTYARAGVVAANVGGDFGMDTVTTPGASSSPTNMDLLSEVSSFGPLGQVPIGPAVGVNTFSTTPDGHTQVVSVQVDASEGTLSDPPLVNPSDSVAATYRAIDPLTGIDHLGAPAPTRATAFVAVQGLPDQAGVANEFLGTDLGQWVSVQLGTSVFDARGHGLTLLNPATDLSDPVVVDPMIATMPTTPASYINRAGPSGKPDLLNAVLNSSEVLSGSGTYDDSFDVAMPGGSPSLLQAREFLITETPTSGGGFRPTESIHYADATGKVGMISNGLTDVFTGRTFELALVETALGPPPTGLLETGETDDFGLIVQVGQVGAGASVVPGEFVFLGVTGGRDGNDIDTLNVPPYNNQTLLIYVDLDPLDTVLGAKTITKLFVVDGSGNGEVDVMEVFTLPEPHPLLMLPAALGLLAILARLRGGRGAPGCAG
jgi:hypothetical protein